MCGGGLLITKSPLNLTYMVAWFIQNVKGTSIRSGILRGVLAATVYSLRMERNQRVFQHKAIAASFFLNSKAIAQYQLILKTVNCIRDSLSSKRGVKQSPMNRALCVSWGLSERIFGPAG